MDTKFQTEGRSFYQTVGAVCQSNLVSAHSKTKETPQTVPRRDIFDKLNLIICIMIIVNVY